MQDAVALGLAANSPRAPDGCTTAVLSCGGAGSATSTSTSQHNRSSLTTCRHHCLEQAAMLRVPIPLLLHNGWGGLLLAQCAGPLAWSCCCVGVAGAQTSAVLCCWGPVAAHVAQATGSAALQLTCA